MQNDRTFPHQRFDAYQNALILVRDAKVIADAVPRGYRSFADQLLRSSGGVALLIAEGVSRGSNAQKRQRLIEARGEACESAAAVEVLVTLGLAAKEPARTYMRLADRVVGMINGLLRYFA